jgi:hypothetical protein
MDLTTMENDYCNTRMKTRRLDKAMDAPFDWNGWICNRSSLAGRQGGPGTPLPAAVRTECAPCHRILTHAK